MLSCYQMPGMNMLQHGKMVADYYADLYNHLKFDTKPKYEWVLPIGLTINREAISASALNPSEAFNYHYYHDCAKAICRIVDEDGKQHFPNHAEESYKQWIKHGGDEETGWYILHDMDLHTLRGDELKSFLKEPRILTLLLTAWSEIHANSSMFGGIDTTSFKIKYKQLAKITKWIMENKND